MTPSPKEFEPEIEPGYIRLLESGLLERRVGILRDGMERCELCPRRCRVSRLRGDLGKCRTSELAAIASATLHFGEEPCLTGKNGSGNIFFAGCNLECVYCQNYQISQAAGRQSQAWEYLDEEQLGLRLIDLQNQGAHVINFVSPSHAVPQMAGAILRGARRGLRLPIAYNTNAYDSVETLRELEGIVDIYLPDLKYGEDEAAVKYSHAPRYVETARAAILEMHRQAGPLVLDSEGIARRGVIIRHLILPNDLASTELCLRWIAEAIGPDASVSLMAQYCPAHRALEDDLLSRPIRPREYERAIELCERLGLSNVFLQDLESSPRHYLPDFTRERPFGE